MQTEIYIDGNRYSEHSFSYENDFETLIKDNSNTLFGKNSIYLDLKNKVDTKALGGTIPDGFLFDFSDVDNPEFYLVEVELNKHSFYNHIFPQITKFFAFFRIPDSRNALVEKLFTYIQSNKDIEKEFINYLGDKEIYRSIKDIVDNSQNILLIIDEMKPELDEIMETYTDTWDKMVKISILKKYSSENNGKNILAISPPFQEINFLESNLKDSDKDSEKYTEAYHLESVEKNTIEIYESIKQFVRTLDSNIIINSQKYYISFKGNKNFAFILLKRKKIHLVVMLPHELAEQRIKVNLLKKLAPSVQKFYNGPCVSITIDNKDGLNEVYEAIQESYKAQGKK